MTTSSGASPQGTKDTESHLAGVSDAGGNSKANGSGDQSGGAPGGGGHVGSGTSHSLQPPPPPEPHAAPNSNARQHQHPMDAAHTTPSSQLPASKTDRPHPTDPGRSPPTAAAAPAAAAAQRLLRPAAALRGRAGRVREAVDAAGSALLSAAVGLGARLNTLTGYNVIEQHKAKVDEADAGLARARESLRDSKAAYEARVAEHGDAQRQLMALLQRKSSWGRSDLESFTDLCERELELERAVVEAKAAHGAAAEALEGAHAAVLRAIRERYAAETLWSDKIRRASTWWTAGLMGLNLASFLSVYLVMEPIKARRLRAHVEEVMSRELGALHGALAGLQAAVHGRTAAAEQPGTEPASADGAAALATGLAATAAAPRVGGAGSDGTESAGPAAAAAAAALSQVVPELRHVCRQLEAVERRVAEVGGGLGEQAAAVQALRQAVEPLAAAAAAAAATTGEAMASGRGGALRLDGQGRGQGAPVVEARRSRGADATEPGSAGAGGGGVQGLDGGGAAAVEGQLAGGWRVRLRRAGQAVSKWLVAWGGAAGSRMRQAVATPEASSAAAAFAGAVLGAGVLVLLDRRR